VADKRPTKTKLPETKIDLELPTSKGELVPYKKPEGGLSDTSQGKRATRNIAKGRGSAKRRAFSALLEILLGAAVDTEPLPGPEIDRRTVLKGIGHGLTSLVTPDIPFKLEERPPEKIPDAEPEPSTLNLGLKVLGEVVERNINAYKEIHDDSQDPRDDQISTRIHNRGRNYLEHHYYNPFLLEDEYDIHKAAQWAREMATKEGGDVESIGSMGDVLNEFLRDTNEPLTLPASYTTEETAIRINDRLKDLVDKTYDDIKEATKYNQDFEMHPYEDYTSPNIQLKKRIYDIIKEGGTKETIYDQLGEGNSFFKKMLKRSKKSGKQNDPLFDHRKKNRYKGKISYFRGLGYPNIWRDDVWGDSLGRAVKPFPINKKNIGGLVGLI
jgi:hypothetical protein